MRRFVRFSHGVMPLGMAGLMWIVSSGFAGAEQPTIENSLRPASKPESQVVQASATTPVGTAVRAGKRSPELLPPRDLPPAREHSVLTERPRSRPAPTATSATYQRRPGRSVTRADGTYTSTNVLNGTVTVRQDPEETLEDGSLFEYPAGPPLSHLESLDDSECGLQDCYQCCLLPCPRLRWDDVTIFAGVEAFTGPKNAGQSGSFGFHEGFNWGAPVPSFDGCLGVQAGARFTQANLSGTEISPDTRDQIFLTGGVFRRVDYGLQYGVVVDYQSDSWYTETDLTQIRVELGWVYPCANELGFWMAVSLEEDTQDARVFVNQVPVDTSATWESTDLYAFYYRHRFDGWEGLNARIFAGFTGTSDGLLGTDFQLPLSCDIALQAGFSYLIPEEAKGPADAGNEEESWNVAISLVWFPGCATATSKSYFAPLFNVADNGSFMVDRLR
jgi:hypothetical protein